MQHTKLFGVDIASRRTDDLDRQMLQYITKRTEGGHTVTALDIGCGQGGQSVLMATAGASVSGVDIVDYAESFSALRKEYDLTVGQLSFTHDDIQHVSVLPNGKPYDICCLQRTIHYLPYENALRVLVWLRQHIDQKLYVSVTGIESDIGRDYADAAKTVQERFCVLSDADAEIFHITQPVCLYTPEEFIALLQKSGWTIEECWVSAFGNIKAVCS